LTYRCLNSKEVNDLNQRAAHFSFGSLGAFVGLIVIPKDSFPADQLVFGSLGVACVLFFLSHFLSENARALWAYYSAGTAYLIGFGLLIGGVTVLVADFVPDDLVLALYAIAALIILRIVWNKLKSMWSLYWFVKRLLRCDNNTGDS
jgi:hypothetical protein